MSDAREGLIVAAPASGSGKTVVTLGLLQSLNRAGVATASAKAGPDYIDPARDTPEHLKEYATYFHPRLRALTGSPEQIAAAAKVYRVYYAKAKMEEDDDPDDYLMDHSSVTYLMGPDGRFRIHFTHGTDAETMAARIREHL